MRSGSVTGRTIRTRRLGPLALALGAAALAASIAACDSTPESLPDSGVHADAREGEDVPEGSPDAPGNPDAPGLMDDAGDAGQNVHPDATPPGDATPDSGLDAGSMDATTARPLGTVSGLMSMVACGSSGVPAGGQCTGMTIHCPNIPDMPAIVAVTHPRGTPIGTIFAHQGSGGMDFYESNINEFVAAGFTVAQVRYTSQWQLSANDSILAGGCRPATLMQWVFDNVHMGSRTTAFCGIGHSGGSGALGYALAHYGMERLLDYASLGAGPPFARIDYGCAPQIYNGPRTTLCPELLDAPYDLPGGLDSAEGTNSCRTNNPPPADIAKWAADSIVSPSGDFDYPNTVVDFFDCTNMPNGTTGGAFFYSSAITSAKSVTCFTGAQGCANEGVGSYGNGVILDDMMARCVPRH